MIKEFLTQHGAFSWNELMTSDVAGAKAFYSELFGWEMRDEPMPEGTYTILKAGEHEVGGLMALPKDVKDIPPIWGSYVTVDDVDQQISRVEQLGGKMMIAPQDIPNVGRFAVISDPQGAMLTLITYSEKCLAQA